MKLLCDLRPIDTISYNLIVPICCCIDKLLLIPTRGIFNSLPQTMSQPVDHRLLYLVGFLLLSLYAVVSCIIFSSGEDRKKELHKVSKVK